MRGTGSREAEMAEDGENRHAVSCIKKGRRFGAICVFITSDPADNALT